LIAVVHLVWGPLGPEPLREFLGSYRRHAAGIDHELVVLFNGVSREQRDELVAELEGIEHRLLTLEEPVQDLLAYRQAAQRLDHECLCVLNSYSVILAPNWLAKLADALDQPAAGLAGATGSWASLRSLALNALSLPNAYRGVAPERRLAFELFEELERELEGGDVSRSLDSGAQGRSPARSMRAALDVLQSTSAQVLRFESFPAAHLRTNGFMVRRAVFAEVRIGTLSRKMDAYSLESGRNSLTRQVRGMGLRPLVVDREGAPHNAQDWAQSRTFWQGDQEKLLIADNQTRIYANGGLDRRRLLSALAWGKRADPQMPSANVR
jgi:hypothetical protein